eukprot:465232-Pleurochrysis_carterae.AAC.2
MHALNRLTTQKLGAPCSHAVRCSQTRPCPMSMAETSGMMVLQEAAQSTDLRGIDIHSLRQ